MRTASTLDHSGRPQKRSSHPKLQALTGTSYSCSVLESGFGPTLPTWALQQVVGYLRYTGRDANAVAKAARDPKQTFGPDQPSMLKSTLSLEHLTKRLNR